MKSGLRILIGAPKVPFFVVKKQALLPKVPIFETQKMALLVPQSKFFFLSFIKKVPWNRKISAETWNGYSKDDHFSADYGFIILR